MLPTIKETGGTAFIGRTDILGIIDEALGAKNLQRVMCIDGAGGIGKTRLLLEVYKRYAGRSPETLIVIPIIDFDDSSYHIPGNVENRIAQALGNEKFDEYWQKLKDLRLMEKAGVSLREISEQKARGRTAFLGAFRRATAQKRVVLLLDTAEKQRIGETWEQIISLVKQADNLLLLVAGRDAENVWELLKAELGGIVSVRSLEPLTLEDSRRYLDEKQKNLRINIETSLSNGLLVLAQGHPILLDLAVEWIARDLPRDWIAEMAANRPETGNLAARREEFEILLVSRITQIRTPIDRLTLLLSRVYPLDVEGIAELMRIPEDEAASLYQEASNYVFFKRLPGNRLSLHDEMRRMMNEHVWRQIDPNQERRARDSRLASVYLKRKIEKIASQLKELETQNRSEAQTAHPSRSLMEVGIVEREGWVLRGQYLEHLLFFNLIEGVNEFNRFFDEDSSNNPREILVNAIQPFINQMADTDKIGVFSRQITFYNEKGDFSQSLELSERFSADKKLEIVTKVATAKMRLGKVLEAVSDLNEALALCKTLPGLETRQSAILNVLGQAHRTMGRLAEASAYYEQAMKIAKTSPDATRAQIAGMMNNLAYVWSLEGRHRSAYNYCKEALMIREASGTSQDKGISYSTMGEVHRNWRKYAEALEYYNKALDVFEPENNPLWLARVYSQRGAVYRLQGEYDNAENDLLRSIEYNIPIEKPQAYHILGLVHWNRGNLQAALKQFELSNRLATDTNDAFTQINNLVAYAEVHFLLWSNQKQPALADKINEYAKTLEDLLGQGYDYPSHLGRMQRVLGDVAFSEKKYEQAMKIYAYAYAELGKRSGGFGVRGFQDEINFLSEKIKLLSGENPQEALLWCDYLLDYWSDEKLSLLRRDELLSLCELNKIEIELGLLR